MSQNTLTEEESTTKSLSTVEKKLHLSNNKNYKIKKVYKKPNILDPRVSYA